MIGGPLKAAGILSISLPSIVKIKDLTLEPADQVSRLSIEDYPREITEFPHGFPKHGKLFPADLSGLNFAGLRSLTFI